MDGGDQVRPRARRPPLGTGGGGTLSSSVDDSDRHLVDQFLRARDEVSFLGFYRRHNALLYRLIVRTLGGVDLADDVLQETWIRAVSALRGFRWESSLRTWLAGIALRCSREALRTRPPVSRDAAETCSGSTEPLRVDLERAVAALPSGRREVLILHDVEGFTHAEIAALLGIDVGTSKSQLARARNALRDRLAGG